MPVLNPGAGTTDEWDMVDPFDSPDQHAPQARREIAQMTRVAGGLWTLGAVVGAGCAFVPGTAHKGLGWLLGLSLLVFLYGVGLLTGAIPWRRASERAHALGTMFTAPVLGLAIYLSGGSLSYMGAFLFCFLLFIAFFFPPRWAWPLSIELVLIAGTPLLYDSEALDNAFLPRYLALVASFCAITAVMVRLKQRLVDSEARQREYANLDSLTGVGNRRAFDRELHQQLEVRNGPHGGRREADASPSRC